MNRYVEREMERLATDSARDAEIIKQTNPDTAYAAR
jgi:hypothetical protein